jgi:hypothetical protein
MTAFGQKRTFEMTSRFSVDFNELIEHDLVMLSQADERTDVTGVSVALVQGLQVEVQEENRYDDGLHEVLFARGVVEANTTGTWSHVKWLCRIDSAGITDLVGD